MGLKIFLKSKLLKFVLIGGFLLNFLVWLILWLGLDLNKTTLIIHYNSFFGIDKFSVNSGLNRFFEIFFAPLSGLFILIVNYLLGGFLIFSGWKKTGEKEVSDVSLGKLPASMLGGFLILITGIILQMTVLVYAIAIFLINR
jgi:hypothetical protein